MERIRAACVAIVAITCAVILLAAMHADAQRFLDTEVGMSAGTCSAGKTLAEAVVACGYESGGQPLPSGTQGDVLWFDDGFWIVLPLGGEDQVLTVDRTGARPAVRWEDPQGGDAGNIDPGNNTGEVAYWNNSAQKWVPLASGPDGTCLTSKGVGSIPVWGPCGTGATHQVNGTPLATQDPVNLEDTPGAGGVAFSNPGDGRVRGSVPTPSAHAHSSHTGIGPDDHHPQSHSHASHTGIGANDHHTPPNTYGLPAPGTQGQMLYSADGVTWAILPVVWNVTTTACTDDTAGGKLTVNGAGEIICAPDQTGGVGGGITSLGGATQASQTFAKTADTNVDVEIQTDTGTGVHTVVATWVGRLALDRITDDDSTAGLCLLSGGPGTGAGNEPAWGVCPGGGGDPTEGAAGVVQAADGSGGHQVGGTRITDTGSGPITLGTPDDPTTLVLEDEATACDTAGMVAGETAFCTRAGYAHVETSAAQRPLCHEDGTGCRTSPPAHSHASHTGIGANDHHTPTTNTDASTKCTGAQVLTGDDACTPYIVSEADPTVDGKIGTHAAIGDAHHTQTVNTDASTKCTGTNVLNGSNTCVGLPAEYTPDDATLNPTTEAELEGSTRGIDQYVLTDQDGLCPEGSIFRGIDPANGDSVCASTEPAQLFAIDTSDLPPLTTVGQTIVFGSHIAIGTGITYDDLGTFTINEPGEYQFTAVLGSEPAAANACREWHWVNTTSGALVGGRGGFYLSTSGGQGTATGQPIAFDVEDVVTVPQTYQLRVTDQDIFCDTGSVTPLWHTSWAEITRLTQSVGTLTGGGAPSDSTFLTATSNPGLSNERVASATTPPAPAGRENATPNIGASTAAWHVTDWRVGQGGGANVIDPANYVNTDASTKCNGTEVLNGSDQCVEPSAGTIGGSTADNQIALGDTAAGTIKPGGMSMQVCPTVTDPTGLTNPAWLWNTSCTGGGAGMDWMESPAATFPLWTRADDVKSLITPPAQGLQFQTKIWQLTDPDGDQVYMVTPGSDLYHAGMADRIPSAKLDVDLVKKGNVNEFTMKQTNSAGGWCWRSAGSDLCIEPAGAVTAGTRELGAFSAVPGLAMIDDGTSLTWGVPTKGIQVHSVNATLSCADMANLIHVHDAPGNVELTVTECPGATVHIVGNKGAGTTTVAGMTTVIGFQNTGLPAGAWSAEWTSLGSGDWTGNRHQ